MFSPKGRRKETSLSIERNLTDNRLIVPLSPSRCVWTQHRAAVQTQHTTNHLLKVPVILILQSFNSSAAFSTFDAIEIIAFLRAPFPSACISSPVGFGISHVAFKEPSFFGNAVPESLYKTAVVCMSKRSLIEIGQRSSCGPQILGHPAAHGSVKGCTSIQKRTCRFQKNR